MVDDLHIALTRLKTYTTQKIESSTALQYVFILSITA